MTRITYVDPFTVARPIGFIKLEPEAAILFQILPETQEIRKAERQKKKGESQTLGDRARECGGIGKSRGSLSVPSLRRVLPEERGLRRSLPIHKGKPPRPEVRAYELGLQLSVLQHKR